MSKRVITGGLGDIVRTERLKLGISQTELAAKIGVSQTYVSNMELNRVQLPNATVRRALAETLHMSHLDLMIRIGELEPEEVPGRDAVRPMVYGLLAELNRLPPKSRQAVEQIIRDVVEVYTVGEEEGSEGSSDKARKKAARDE